MLSLLFKLKAVVEFVNCVVKKTSIFTAVSYILYEGNQERCNLTNHFPFWKLLCRLVKRQIERCLKNCAKYLFANVGDFHLLPPAYVVRREGNVLTRVCPSICLSTGGVPISHNALQHYPECHGADTWLGGTHIP